VRAFLVTGVVALICASGGTAIAGAVAPLAWMTPPNRLYVVPLPKAWRLHVEITRAGERDAWVDPTDRGQKLVITVSRCAACVTSGGKPHPRAVVPRYATTTHVASGVAMFVGHVRGDSYTEHGLVVIRRDRAGSIAGSFVLQLWMPNVLAPGSEDREWSYILVNFAAKGTKGD
jgi:hypothetical protein